MKSLHLFKSLLLAVLEVLVCIAVFMASGFVPSKDAAYNKRVIGFFRKLSIPASEAEATDENVIRGLMSLYAIAFVITGSLFIVMGIPSAEVMSGKLAIGSGIVCLIGASVFYSKRIRTASAITIRKTSEQ